MFYMEYKDRYGTYRIERPTDSEHFSEMVELFFKPLAKAAGYAEETINEHVGEALVDYPTYNN